MNGRRNDDGLAAKLKKFDNHSSVANEYRVHTSSGAVLSTATLLVILYLIYTEFHFNLRPSIRNNVHVNATTPVGVEVEFDVTFPSVPCALLSIDANDPMGQRQSLHIDRTHRVWKHRLDEDGNMKGHRTKFELGNTLQNEDHLKEFADKNIEFDGDGGDDDDLHDFEESCGSCYGAGDEGECCNTCDDVKRVYQRKGWFFDNKTKKDIKQCEKEKRGSDEKGEGCNVHGIVALSSGGGDLHLAPGHGLENFGREVTFSSLSDLMTQAFDSFNVSHTVNKLRFGEEFPGHVFQLDGQPRMIEDAYGMYQYYIKIVPTLFKFLNGTTIQTNQYSVTEHMRHVSPSSNRGLPGVYFFYEVSALHVEIEEYRHGWVRFLTSIAAVIGGVFSAMGAADSYMFSTMNRRGRAMGGLG